MRPMIFLAPEDVYNHEILVSRRLIYKTYDRPAPRGLVHTYGTHVS